MVNNNQKTHIMSNATLPAVYVTNYQQYIDGTFLQKAITENVPDYMEGVLPQSLYVSISYIDIKKVSGKANTYLTKLVLSISGRSYDYTLMHSNTDLYLAKAGLDQNEYSTQATKDRHAALLQQAFETLVFMRAGRITEDLIANSVNLQ